MLIVSAGNNQGSLEGEILVAKFGSNGEGEFSVWDIGRRALIKRGFPLAGFLLFLSASLVFPGEPRRPGQPERPKFNAIQVVSEKDVLNAKDCLGAPDGRYAEILPGGQLVVLMEKTFIDVGTLVCKGEMDYGLEGWFRVQDTQDERQDYAWIPFWSGRFILPEMWPGGFSFGPGRPGLSLYGGLGVDKIRVTNIGTKSLFVDAVIGYGMEGLCLSMK